MPIYRNLKSKKLIIDGLEVKLPGSVNFEPERQELTFFGVKHNSDYPFALTMVYEQPSDGEENSNKKVMYMNGKLPFESVVFDEFPNNPAGPNIEVVYRIPEFNIKVLASVTSKFVSEYQSAKIMHDNRVKFASENGHVEPSENEVKAIMNFREKQESKSQHVAIFAVIIAVLGVFMLATGA